MLSNIFNNYMIGLGTIVIRKKYLDNLKYIFDKRFHIIGDFDLSIRMAEICKFDCVQKPISYFRVHDKNESYLNKDKEISQNVFIGLSLNPNMRLSLNSPRRKS